MLFILFDFGFGKGFLRKFLTFIYIGFKQKGNLNTNLYLCNKIYTSMSKSRLIEVNKYNMPLFMKKDEEKRVFDAFPSQLDKNRKEKPRRKEGVLYTANKYNMKLFEPNIYSGEEPGSSKMEIGGVETSGLGNTNFASSLPSVGGGLDFSAGKALGSAMSAGSSGGAGLLGGLSGGLGSALKGIGGGAISGIGSMVGGAVGNLISGGYESGVGNVLGSLGKVASVIPGPWGAAISGGLQVLGGGVNALFGSKVNQAKLNAANKNISALNSFNSNAKSLDDIKGITATSSVANTYQGGAFNTSAGKEQEALEERMRAARQFADRSIGNNISNLIDDQQNNALANFSAFGGPITRRRKRKKI